jgi:hypothetical protein
MWLAVSFDSGGHSTSGAANHFCCKSTSRLHVPPAESRTGQTTLPQTCSWRLQADLRKKAAGGTHASCSGPLLVPVSMR